MTIVFDSVDKRYGRREVLNGVSFACEPGSVTGLLGPNGAGKSTLIRCLLGLTRLSGGTSTIDGIRVASMHQPQRQVGAVLDPAAHHPGRSARHTIEICAGYLSLPRQDAGRTLEYVGLGDAGAKPFRALSLGMKQRLAIGIALLASPRFLVLDEPMNGLDVDGVRWFRRTVTDFASRGGTVLVSSHMLAELQAYADHIVTIKDGRVVDDRAMREVSRDADTIVRPSDLERLRAILDRFEIVHGPDVDSARLRVASSPEKLARIAFDNGILLFEVRPGTAKSLEDHYLQVMSEGGEELDDATQ